MRILLVEDEKKVANFIVRGLKEENYAVDIAADGETAWDYVSSNDYDVVILDWMIPKMSGIELCKSIRQSKIQVPLLMLTARDAVEDRILGLDSGADDYLTKPFAFEELLARIRALIRRPRSFKEESLLKCAGITLDLIARRVYCEGEEIMLSQKEFGILDYLLRHKGEVVSRTALAEHVWDIHFDPMSNTIDVFMNYLRKKIDGNRKKSRIETLRGSGYRLVEE